MNSRGLALALVAWSLTLPSFRAGAAGSDIRTLAESVRQGCDKELRSYCSQVTPGEGRQLACLYAHGDKLSGRCEYALYDASVQLERAVGAITYLARECQSDIDARCSSISPGQGRILDCLKKKPKELSGRCSAALDDVGAK